MKFSFNPIQVDKIKPTNIYEVIIIGAGAAGIGAAVTLARKGISFALIEARDRMGGRILSTKIDGVEQDMGACWVHSYSKKNPICKEVNKIGWKSRKSYPRGDSDICS
jgi:phytoene dehydrogenase-like protein